MMRRFRQSGAIIQLLTYPVLCLPPGMAFGQDKPSGRGPAVTWKAPPPVRTAKASPPRVPRVSAPSFVRSVKLDADDNEIINSRILNVPFARRAKRGLREGVRRTFNRTLNQYNAKAASPASERLEVLITALANEPNSDVSASMWLEAGKVAASSGHFKTALNALTHAWEQTQNEALDSPSAEVAELALGQLVELYMRTGLKTELHELLDRIEDRPPHILSSALIAGAKQRLEEWETNPLASVECGVVAYNMIASRIGQPVINRYTKPRDNEQAEAIATWGLDLDEEQSRQLIESGLSAGLLLRRVHTVSPDWTWTYRSAGDSVPVPSIVHLRFSASSGHYAAVIESAPGKVRVEDPFLGISDWIELKALNESASGFFLVPGSTELGASFKAAGDAQLEGIFGRTTCPTGNNKEGNSCQRPSCNGMMVPSITGFIPQVSVFDRPLTYQPLWGPGLDLTLEYQEVNYASGDSYGASDTSNFGPGWKHGLHSYIRSADGAAINGGNSKLQWVTPSTYYEYTYTSGGYVAPYVDRPRLTSIAGGYRLSFADGSQLDFCQGNASSAKKYYLSQVRDRQGYVLTLVYDSLVRLSSILDATGKSTVFGYSGNGYFIQSITDPFGRVAVFGYNGNRLNSITDAIGLVSTIAYDTSSPQLVASITTPYGTTSFTHGYNTIEKVDPEGYTTRNEFFYHDGNLPFTLGPDEEPRPPASIRVGSTNVSFLTTQPQTDHFHVTLEWNRKQWREYENYLIANPGASHPTSDKYKFAEMTLWLQGNGGVTMPIPIAHKVPGRAAVWYNYPGQIAGYAWRVGTSSQPIRAARQTEDENGVVRWVMTQQTYTAAGLLETTTDEMGRTATRSYSGADLTSVAAGGHVLQSYTGHVRGIPSAVIEASNLTITTQRNAKDQPTLVTTSKGVNTQAVKMTYDTDGVLEPDEQPDGYPGRLMQIEQTDPANASGFVVMDTFEYDAFGRVKKHKDAGGYETETDYDAFDRPTLITHPDDSTEQFVYDRLDLVASKDRAGRWTRRIIDSIQRTVATVTPDQKITTYEWCSCGSLYKLIDPAGRATEWKRDILGRVTEKIMPDGVTKTTYSYYKRSGLLASVTRPNQQGGTMPTVTYRYYVDRKIHKEDYADNTTASGVADVTYFYETAGLGRLLSRSTGSESYTQSYRPFGQAGGGQLEYVDGPWVNDRVETVYDWMDRPSTTKMLSEAGTMEFRSESRSWDSLGRPATVTNALGSFIYGYTTNLARVDSVTRPDNILTSFAYNPNNAPGNSARTLASINHSSTTIPSKLIARHLFSYDSAGRMTSWERQGEGVTGITQTFRHNLGNEVIHTERRVSADATLLDVESWGLDAAGNWTTRSHSDGDVLETRTHDVMNRLVTIGGAGKAAIEGTVNEYARVTVNGATAKLDALPEGGFRYHKEVAVQSGLNVVTIQAKDAGNQTTTRKWQFNVPTSSNTITYDANGNMLSDGQRTFTWDVKSRLRTVTKGATTWKWDYDIDDRRVREYENNSVTKLFFWSGTDVIQERDGNNSIIRTHYTGGFCDGPAALDGLKYQTLTDHLGNVREVIGPGGALAASYDYTSFQGPLKNGGAVEATFQTIGRYYHHAGSGLELALYRAFDPQIGRWLSEDPLAEAGGLNLYAYVGNGPAMRVDQNGDVFWIPLIIIGGLLLAADDANAPGPGDPITGGGGPMRTVAACSVIAAGGAAQGIVRDQVKDVIEDYVMDNVLHFHKGPYTEPTLPPKTIVDEHGVTIEHYYRSGDHGPAHLHVSGEGPDTKIGQNGKPLDGSKCPTAGQQKVIDKNKGLIRRSIDKIQRWYRFWR